MKPHRNILLLAVVLATACSQSASAPAGSGGSGGSGGSSDALARQLCPGACKNVKSCYARLDTAACEAQCGKELAGNGYFIPEFAKEYFQKLKDAAADSRCKVMDLEPWILRDGGSYNTDGADPAAMKPCVDATIKGGGRPPAGNGCFYGYYIYRSQYRDKMKACWKLACPYQDSCGCKAVIPWLAWVAIPLDRNDPFYGSCPPPK
jgi:hypothetical protein